MNKKLIGLISLSALLFMGLECQQQEKIREGFFISTTSEYSTSTPTTSAPRVPPLLVLDEDPDFLPSVSSSSVNVIYDTTNTEPTLFYGPPEVTSTKKYSSSTSSIDKNDPKTWPRFEFKELGFSMQLPFEKKELEYGFNDQYYLPNDNKNIHIKSGMYRYGGIVKNDGEYKYGFIGANSLNFYIEHHTNITDIIDLELGTNPKIILFDGNNQKFYLDIHPIKRFNIQGTEILVFDANKDFFDLVKETFPDFEGIRWGFTFKLPQSEKFKAVVLNFSEEDLTFEKLISTIKTIEFE